MTRTTRRFFTASASALAVALSGLFSTATQAASINYGNVGPVPPGITFTQVTESSTTDTVPLYGPPAPFATGLDFTPLAFGAFSANGGADLTDGQLNFGVEGSGPKGIGQISLFEAGDYTLAGAGTPATNVFAGATLRVTVNEINNVAVTPFNLAPASGSFSDSLPPTVILSPWSLGVTVNVGAQLAALFGPNATATDIDVVIDNALGAFSEPATVAFIAKKEFVIDVVAVDVIPEPATFAMAGVALCGIVLASRKRA